MAEKSDDGVEVGMGVVKGTADRSGIPPDSQGWDERYKRAYPWDWSSNTGISTPGEREREDRDKDSMGRPGA